MDVTAEIAKMTPGPPPRLLDSQPPEGLELRNPIVVILWSFGLYVLMHTWLYLGSWFAVQATGADFIAVLTGEAKSPQIALIVGLTSLVLGIPMTFAIVRYLWRREHGWMCLPFGTKPILVGLGLGLAVPLTIVIVLGVLGAATISGYPGRLSSAGTIAILIGHLCQSLFKGVTEEVVFRGMAVREIAARWGWWVGGLTGGLYFGLAHLVGGIGNISWLDAAWILLASVLANALFVALLLRSHSLWLPIGFHAGWNFCLKAVLGTTMSGNESNLGLFGVELAGPSWLTGGNFGVEASAVSLLFYVLLAAFVLLFPRRRDPIS